MVSSGKKKSKFTQVDISYPKHLQKIYNDFMFLPGRMKISEFQKLVSKTYYKKNYDIHIKLLKLALDQGLMLQARTKYLIKTLVFM